MASLLQGNSASVSADSPLDDAFCPDCNYSLRGLSADRCPECGFSLESLRSGVSQIPWVHRNEIGISKAYRRTIRMVLFHPKEFRNEIVRPVSFFDAQFFRVITIRRIFLPLLLIPLFLYLFQPAGVQAMINKIGWTAVVLELAAILLFIIALTGLPSYFFHPRHIPIELQNRAVALSYYACGILVWLALLPVSVAAALALRSRYSSAIDEFLIAAAVVLSAGLFIAWWLPMVLLARALLHRTRNVVFVAIGLPVLSVLVGVLILVVLPASILYMVLLFRNL